MSNSTKSTSNARQIVMARLFRNEGKEIAEKMGVSRQAVSAGVLRRSPKYLKALIELRAEKEKEFELIAKQLAQ